MTHISSHSWRIPTTKNRCLLFKIKTFSALQDHKSRSVQFRTCVKYVKLYASCELHRPAFMTLEPIRWRLEAENWWVFWTDDFASYLVNKCQIWLIFCLKSHFLKTKMTTTIASVNCYGGFLNTNPKILQTFFTYILEAQQFTLAKVTLNQVLSTQVNSSCLDKVQNMPVEKILSPYFLWLEFVKSEPLVFMKANSLFINNQNI